MLIGKVGRRGTKKDFERGIAMLTLAKNSQAVGGTVSIVVPVYNEQDNVALLIEEIERSLVAFASPWELIIVDDGSTDETVVRRSGWPSNVRLCVWFYCAETSGRPRRCTRGFSTRPGTPS